MSFSHGQILNGTNVARECSVKGQRDLYFWRTKAGLEVDFVIYGELGFWAIEVKNSKNLSPDDVR